jgi:hypothetical protein
MIHHLALAGREPAKLADGARAHQKGRSVPVGSVERPIAISGTRASSTQGARKKPANEAAGKFHDDI